MKSVGIDVSMIPDSPVGVGRYVLELVSHLQDVDRSFNLKLYSRKSDRSRWEQLLKPGDSLMNGLPDTRPLRLAYENLILGQNLAGVDMLHSPHYSVPLAIKKPLVVNIHDLIFFENPDRHQMAKVLYFKSQIKLALKRADRIIVGTDYIKEKVIEMFNPTTAIEVVPYGVDLDQFRHDSNKEAEDLKLISELNLESPFLLYVGTIEPRKKVDDLIKAYNILVDRHLIDSEVKLVLAGKFGWKCESVKELLERNKEKDKIIHLGYVDQTYIGPLFRRALAVIYPSESEGFGLPVLEAMAARTPVITTRNSVMQSFAKDAVSYFTAGDIDELSTRILEVADSYCDSFKLDIGFAIASEYSWANSVKRHIHMYESMLS